MMLHHEYPHRFTLDAVENAVGKAPHEKSADVLFQDAPAVGRFQNHGRGGLKLRAKTRAQAWHLAFVEPRRLGEFRFRIRW
jgi:hypothetical protein